MERASQPGEEEKHQRGNDHGRGWQSLEGRGHPRIARLLLSRRLRFTAEAGAEIDAEEGPKEK